MAPQTILVERYAREIFDGLAASGITVHHFVLHADRDELRRRIEADEPGIRQWRLDHLDAYEKALPWLEKSATVVDTAGTPPAEVARTISAAVN
ncbi:hypothetical protein [Amycolatopsis sp. DSM 110486]|uniref:hypothetical protein n=1 Tax=Amycolatopsis sp. DSM 110486 TaxID=2865832 RepID=UPI001C69F74A|nr:hypothetical protein [Amycolatopsis sp. DSM 110486]QYN17332.1 hypothetical protein K1T34_31495 [Amycolatopsis sp. DSM 110486]